MERLENRRRSPEPCDPRHFDGAATLTRFLAAEPEARGRVYRVAFQAGARTHWHVHSDVQVLYVLEGRCLAQAWEGPVITAEPGDVLRFEAGEKHWHGAADEGPMTHLAVNLGRRTDWLESSR